MFPDFLHWSAQFAQDARIWVIGPYWVVRFDC
jgi:hypothetical protein